MWVGRQIFNSELLHFLSLIFSGDSKSNKKRRRKKIWIHMTHYANQQTLHFLGGCNKYMKTRNLFGRHEVVRQLMRKIIKFKIWLKKIWCKYWRKKEFLRWSVEGRHILFLKNLCPLLCAKNICSIFRFEECKSTLSYYSDINQRL